MFKISQKTMFIVKEYVKQAIIIIKLLIVSHQPGLAWWLLKYNLWEIKTYRFTKTSEEISDIIMKSTISRIAK